MLVDSLLQSGDIPVRLDASGKVLERGTQREAREFDGKTYLMERALPGDVAILRAWKVDEAGNCVFRCVTNVAPLSPSLLQHAPAPCHRDQNLRIGY